MKKTGFYTGFLVLLIIAVTVISGCGQETKFLPYENQEFGIRINQPADWTVSKVTEGAIPALVFTSPKESESDTVIETVSIGGLKLSKPITLEEFNELMMGDIKKNAPNFKLFESGATTVNTYSAYKTVYSYTDEEQKQIKAMGVIVKKDDLVYFIEYVAEVDTYDDYIGTVQKMLDSFEIIENVPVADSGTKGSTTSTGTKGATTGTGTKGGIIGTGTKGTTPGSSGVLQTYENSEYGFKIGYPSDWTKKEPMDIDEKNTEFGTSVKAEPVQFYSPYESDSDEYSEHLTIWVEYFDQSVTLDEITGAFVTSLKENPDVEFIESTETTLAGKHAHKTLYIQKVETDAYEFMWVETMEGNTNYQFLYTSEVDKYDKFLGTVQKMLDSFELI